MNSKAISNLVLLLVAILVSVFFIKPKIASVQALEQKVESYRQVSEKISEISIALNQHLSTIDSQPVELLEKINTFLPQTIDEVEITRELKAMASKNALYTQSIVPGELVVGNTVTPQLFFEEESAASLSDNSPTVLSAAEKNKRTFTVNVFGSYEAFKAYLRDIEQSNHSFAIISITFGNSVGIEGGETNDMSALSAGEMNGYQIQLETYGLAVTKK